MSKITILYDSMTDQQRFDLLVLCAIEGLFCTLRGSASGKETTINTGSRSVIEVVRFIQREGLNGVQTQKIGDTYVTGDIVPDRPYHPPQVNPWLDNVLRNIQIANVSEKRPE